MKRYYSWIAVPGILVAVMCMTLSGSADDKDKKEKSTEPSAEALEKEFAEKLTGCVLNGSFTVQDSKRPPSSDKYSITSAKKSTGDTWIITSRIQYGTHDFNLPISVTVKWAGDTPVITLTNLTIPGMGTFTARVLFYGDRYAGTWQHDKIGGHMYGMIEHPKQEDAKPKTETTPKDKETAK